MLKNWIIELIEKKAYINSQIGEGGFTSL